MNAPSSDPRSPAPLAVLVTGLAGLLLAMVILALCSGRYLLSPAEVFDALAAAVVGAPRPMPPMRTWCSTCACPGSVPPC